MSDMVTDLKCKANQFYSGKGMDWSWNNRERATWGTLNYGSRYSEDKQEWTIKRDSQLYREEVKRQVGQLIKKGGYNEHE